MKFIQVNIFKGEYLEKLVEFFGKEDPDIVAAQEVTSGQFNYHPDKTLNIFEELKKRLNWEGVWHGDTVLKDDLNSRLGNAVFTKYKILKHRIITLKEYRPVTHDEIDGGGAFEHRPLLARHMIDATIEMAPDSEIHALCWHGAWTAPPQDTEETLRQAEIAVGYIKKLNKPFILGGDFNAVFEGKTIQMINKVATNLIDPSRFCGTLNQAVHKIAPINFLVDYIFTSADFRCLNLTIPEITVSDHLPVIAELELK